jgi:hypothetical protein
MLRFPVVIFLNAVVKFFMLLFSLIDDFLKIQPIEFFNFLFQGIKFFVSYLHKSKIPKRLFLRSSIYAPSGALKNFHILIRLFKNKIVFQKSG